jgi:hypothetical protein
MTTYTPSPYKPIRGEYEVEDRVIIRKEEKNNKKVEKQEREEVMRSKYKRRIYTFKWCNEN